MKNGNIKSLVGYNEGLSNQCESSYITLKKVIWNVLNKDNFNGNNHLCRKNPFKVLKVNKMRSKYI